MEDWEVLTDKGDARNPDGTVNERQWERLMIKQIKTYVQRDLTDIAAMNCENIEQYNLLVSMRILLEYDPGQRAHKIGVEIEKANEIITDLRQVGLDDVVSRFEAACIAILRARNAKIPTAMQPPKDRF